MNKSNMSNDTEDKIRWINILISSEEEQEFIENFEDESKKIIKHCLNTPVISEHFLKIVYITTLNGKHHLRSVKIQAWKN